MWFVAVVSFVANIVEILVGASALYLAWTQGDKISAAFSILFSYSLQTSLADLKHWLEKLHENSTEAGDTSKKFRTALAHISGKIRGNPALKKHFGDKMLKRLNVMIEELDDDRVVTETSKVSLYSEIKESLSTLEVQNYQTYSKKYEHE